MLYLLALLNFLYVSCEVGVWNWLAKHLMAQGMPEASALWILSFGFALGILVGRVVVSRVLMRVSAPDVILACSALMIVTTSAMLWSAEPLFAGVAVFCAGLAMAPVNPTTVCGVTEHLSKPQVPTPWLYPSSFDPLIPQHLTV